MKYFTSCVTVLLTFIILTGCGKKETIDNKQATAPSPKGTSSIVASIVSIDSTKLSSDKNSPCSVAPCWAEIRIEQISGKGKGGPILSVGDTISTNFKFTLSETTEELIPNLDKRMPGLNIGEKFKADIRSILNTNKKNLYSIYYYEKI